MTKELKEKALQLCYAIEDLPASEQQTKISIMASDLHGLLEKLVSQNFGDIVSEKFNIKKIPEYFKGWDENIEGVYNNEEYFETDGKRGYEINLDMQDKHHRYVSYWVDNEERLSVPEPYVRTFADFITNCEQVGIELQAKISG